MPPSADQKTEKPTQRKRRRAREEGEVAQSAEVNNALVLLAAVGALGLFGMQMVQTMTGKMCERLGGLHTASLTMSGAASLLLDSVSTVLRAVAPLVACVGAVGLLCSLGQTGIIFSTKKLKPDLKNIDPIKGAKNLLSVRALVRLLMAAIKLTAIVLIAYFLLRSKLPWMFALAGKSFWGIFFAVRQLSLALLFRIVVAMLGVAVLDYAYQRWQFSKQLMMTKQELKEEHKRDEGSPEVRGRQAQMRRSVLRSRMIQAVPESSVVVTNPTQFAIALKWDEQTMSAPQVVAKGKGYLAQRIKQVARDHNVPVLERKLLARTLYQAVEVGMEIPADLYRAVAEVLAFVMKKRKRA